jgi:hypothetical protein
MVTQQCCRGGIVELTLVSLRLSGWWAGADGSEQRRRTANPPLQDDDRAIR